MTTQEKMKLYRNYNSLLKAIFTGKMPRLEKGQEIIVESRGCKIVSQVLVTKEN